MQDRNTLELWSKIISEQGDVDCGEGYTAIDGQGVPVGDEVSAEEEAAAACGDAPRYGRHEDGLHVLRQARASRDRRGLDVAPAAVLRRRV